MNIPELYARRSALLPAFHEYLDVCNAIVRLEHAQQGDKPNAEVLPTKAVKRVARPTKDEQFLKAFSALSEKQQLELLKGVSFDE